MTAYILRRLLATIPVMVVVALFVFLLLHLTPGDPAAVIAGAFFYFLWQHTIRESIAYSRQTQLGNYSAADQDVWKHIGTENTEFHKKLETRSQVTGRRVISICPRRISSITLVP